MNMIVAADKNWAIGNRGQLLVSIPQDQKMFREETLGKVVVMGRKTLESLPGGQPLYGRTNVILTSDLNYQVKGGIVVHSVEEALEFLKDYPSEDIFVIGGESVYRQFLPFCNVAHVTWIDYEYAADTYFPNLEQSRQWQLAAVSDEQTYFNLCYEFRMYVRTEQEISSGNENT